MIRSVIFDMDGTLLDTERIYHQGWNAVAERMGLSNADESYRPICGKSRETIREIFYGFFGRDVDFDTFYSSRDRWIADYLKKNGVPAKPFAKEILSSLKERGIGVALASATRQPRVNSNLSETGLIGYFDAIVTGDMITHGKPDPEIFLKAAEKLGTPAGECAVVEDALSGLQGARAAGMVPIMVHDQFILEEARPIIAAECDNLREVLDFILEYNRKEEGRI